MTCITCERTIRVETGRHERKLNSNGKPEKIPRCERLCKNCNTNSVEDEYHFLLICSLYNSNRNVFISKLFLMYPNLQSLDTHELFMSIMINDDENFVVYLFEFIESNYEVRKNHNMV